VSISPRLMVGVPTGFLHNQTPPPSPIAANVGIEIEPGLGISVDGRAILVGPKESFERTEIQNQQKDRTFLVTREGLKSVVDGHYDRQDFTLTSQGNRLDAKGNSQEESITADGLNVTHAKAGRSYDVSVNGSEASVISRHPEGRKYLLTHDVNTSRVNTGYAESDFTFTRNDDGTITIDGQIKPQDFTIGRDASGALVVQGYYPQQRYVITSKAS